MNQSQQFEVRHRWQLASAGGDPTHHVQVRPRWEPVSPCPGVAQVNARVNRSRWFTVIEQCYHILMLPRWVPRLQVLVRPSWDQRHEVQVRSRWEPQSPGQVRPCLSQSHQLQVRLCMSQIHLVQKRPKSGKVLPRSGHSQWGIE